MREVKHHHTPFHSRGNAVKVVAGPGGEGSVPAEYHVIAGPDYSLGVDFMTINNQGVTNEALLAVVQDRLECFQEGQYPCAENEGALRHVRLALAELHHRTGRRVNQGIEGQMQENAGWKEAKMAEKRRVWVEAEMLRIDDGQTGANFKVADLHERWAAWAPVAAALRLFDTPVTAEEMEVLDGIATTTAARNGLAEVKSVLATTSRVRRDRGQQGTPGAS